MKIKYILISFALTIFHSSASWGGNIETVLSSVGQNNPELKASASSWRSDSAALRSSNNLEDPKVDFEYNFGGETGDKWGIGISQGFDWPGSYSARNKANSARIEAMRYADLSSRLDILLKAKRLCLQIIGVNQKIEVQQSICDNIENLYTQYNKAFSHGEASIIDINKIKIERIAANQTLKELSTELNTLKQELSGMNGNVPFDDNLIKALSEYESEDLRTFESYQSDFQAFDPHFAYYEKINESLKSEEKATKMGWLPKFDIGYKYSYEQGEKFNGVTAGASIPLFSNRGKVAAVKSQAILNADQQAQHRSEYESEVKALYSKAVSLKSQLAQYGDVIGDNKNFEVLKKALDGGQISLLNYLLELRYFIEAKDKYIELNNEYHITLAELNRYDLIK